jgi:hypothetical protein
MKLKSIKIREIHKSVRIPACPAGRRGSDDLRYSEAARWGNVNGTDKDNKMNK